MTEKIDLRPKLNILRPEKNHEKKTIVGKQAKKRTKAVIYATVFIFVAFAVFSGNAILSDSDHSSDSWLSKIPIIGSIKRLVENADKGLRGEENDRINILLLGMGGKKHEGGFLTDTIMLVSLKPSEKKVALLSIPRDMSVPINGEWRKINNINAFAEAKKEGSGGEAIRKAVSDLLDVPIDYYARADFEGFVNIINEVGDIKVYVENTLDDESYPITGKEDDPSYYDRFEHLYIEKGWQKMDGELALKYARSRHGKGGEGSDFARARRQQKILEAVKEKVLSKFILFKPRMISNILDELKEHVSTNLNVWEVVKIWDMFKDAKGEDIINRTLDNTPDGMLIDMRAEDGAYLLTPRSGSFSEIQYMVNNIFTDKPVENKKRVVSEEALVDILNGTKVDGLASKVAQTLKNSGFNMGRLDNYANQDFEKSTIYDLTYGEKMDSLIILKEKTGADIAFGLPEWLIKELSAEIAKEKDVEQPDFILILGQDKAINYE